MKPRPYSIRIFLPDGTPDGLRVVEKSNWTGQGIVCPRAVLGEAKGRDEFGRTGVYILIGTPDPGHLPTIYVGQGDVIRTRLIAHQSGKDFWDRVVFFTSKDASLNRAHVTYLEARLLQLAGEAKRCHIDNDQLPQVPTLAEAEREDVESFLLDIVSIVPLLGIHAFEKIRHKPAQRPLLTMRAKGAEARGYEDAEGFVVIEGSQAVADEVPSTHAYMKTLRHELSEREVLVPRGDLLAFAQDYAFNSPSTAAGVVAGRSANGRVEWKDERGRTLKEIQEEETGAEVEEESET